jgi:excisionase family DNA binding protein
MDASASAEIRLVGLEQVLRAVVQEEVAAQREAFVHERQEWFSVASAAKYADTTQLAVRDAERRGELRGYRSSEAKRRLRFHRDDLDAWLMGRARA